MQPAVFLLEYIDAAGLDDEHLVGALSLAQDDVVGGISTPGMRNAAEALGRKLLGELAGLGKGSVAGGLFFPSGLFAVF